MAAADIDVDAPLVVGKDERRSLVLDQPREAKAGTATLLLELCGRNNAPAPTLAALEALEALEAGTDPVLVSTPVDQTVVDLPAFTTALQGAVRPGTDGDTVILGVTPERADTGYGYIRADASTGPAAVQHLLEKSNRPTAQRHLAEGGSCWNSGMFMLEASPWMAALERLCPDVAVPRGSLQSAAPTTRRSFAPGPGPVCRGARRVGGLRRDGALPTAATHLSAWWHWRSGGTTWSHGMRMKTRRHALGVDT